MAKKTPLTEQQEAPAPVYAASTMPRQRRIERQGASTEPYTLRYPQVRGGICEYCGVLDGNYPAEQQYKLCGHYRGMQLACSYCPDSKNPDEVIGHSVLNIAGHPDNPDRLVVWCDSYECSSKHLKRFKTSGL